MRKELRIYLDCKVPGWQEMSCWELHKCLTALWKAGKFKRLVTAVFDDSRKAVRVGDGFFSYVVM